MAWKVGKTVIDTVGPDFYWDSDPRGLLCVWEPPNPTADYVIGVDPTVGLTGWNRYARTRDDAHIDNAVINVLRVGRPDVQAAEFAAPIDALDLAEVVNAVGKLYCGRSEEGEALVIVETTGPGVITIPELTSRWGYTNLWRWHYLDQSTVKRTVTLGWQATQDSNKALFMKCLRHVNSGKVRASSPWLVEEMADCTSNWVTAQVRAKWGRHDDRVRAFFLSIWAAHDWSSEIDDYEPSIVEDRNLPDYQHTAISYEEMMADWDDRMDKLTRD